MKLLIVSATEPEIKPLLVHLGITGGMKSYNYKGHQLEILITGVGMTATAYHLGRVLTQEWDFALNLGLAGTFNDNLEPGTVVNIVQDHFAELGAEDGDMFIPISKMNLETDSEVFNESVVPGEVLGYIPRVCGITVNTVHGNEASIDKVFKLYHPNTESMEGAAFLLACKLAAVPCAQIRAISNKVEKRNRDAWNIPLAVKNLNEKAIEIIEEVVRI
ncbi:MAG: futalosine hydrolase [Bacteroidia bacterium]